MFECLNYIWNSGLLMTLFTGVIIPVLAVYLSVKVTNDRAKKKELKDEQIQRVKLLKMLKHELETVIKHYKQESKYYSRETLTGKLIVESSSFNTTDHQELLTKLWEYMRGYQSLNTALDSIPMQFQTVQMVNLEVSRNLFGFYNFKKYENLSKENIHELFENIINDSVNYIIEAAEPLLEEVDELLLTVDAV